MGEEVPKEWFTMEQAAKYLGVSYGRFTTAVKEGIYPVSKVPGFGDTRRISRSRLDQMMKENEEGSNNLHAVADLDSRN